MNIEITIPTKIITANKSCGTLLKEVQIKYRPSLPPPRLS